MINIMRKKKEEITKEEIEKIREFYFDSNDFSNNTVEEINSLTQKTDDEILNIIEGVKYVSKSKLFSYLFCQMQFKYRYIHNIVEEAPEVAEFGTNIHRILQFLYKEIDPQELSNNHNDITDYLMKTMKVMCEPIYPLYPNLDVLLEKIAEYENMRFQRIKRAESLSIENIKKYFFPLYTEIHLRNDVLYMSGIIDAVFLLPNNRIMIVDYKSGKPKDLNEYYDFKNVNDEMYFYKMLISDENTYSVDNINFKPNNYKVEYVQMLFLKDMENSLAISINDLNDDIKFSIIEYFDNLFNNNYEPRYFKNKDVCMKMCPYFTICSKSNKYFSNIIDMDNKIWNNS